MPRKRAKPRPKTAEPPKHAFDFPNGTYIDHSQDGIEIVVPTGAGEMVFGFSSRGMTVVTRTRGSPFVNYIWASTAANTSGVNAFTVNP